MLQREKFRLREGKTVCPRTHGLSVAEPDLKVYLTMCFFQGSVFQNTRIPELERSRLATRKFEIWNLNREEHKDVSTGASI